MLLHTADTNPHRLPDKAERVRAMFSSVSGSYDFLNHLCSAGIDNAWRRAAVRAADVPIGGRVLDVCCGTADLTAAFARLAPQASEVIGADFCHEMLVQGLAKLHARNVSSGRAEPRTGPRTALVEADALRLPFAADAFDVVSCAFGLRNTAEPSRALAECFRVLAPGGRLVILEFTLPSSPIVRGLYQLYFRQVLPLVATVISGDRTGAYRYLPDSVAHWPEPTELEDQLRGLGFVEVSHRLLTLGIAAIHVGVKPGSVASQPTANSSAGSRSAANSFVETRPHA